jgi:hypothetical protein
MARRLRFFVASALVRDLLLRAKHLFVEAMVAGADNSNGDAQNTFRSYSQYQRLLEMAKVGPGHDARAQTAAPILERRPECRGGPALHQG